MSIVNLGFQSIGLAQQEMSEEVEAELNKCNSPADLRRMVERKPEIVSAVADSLSPANIQLTRIMQRLQPKERNFKAFVAATRVEINDFWTALLALGATLQAEEKIIYKTLTYHKKIVEFIQSCCQSAHYSFDVLKCGQADCQIFKPIRLPMEVCIVL